MVNAGGLTLVTLYSRESRCFLLSIDYNLVDKQRSFAFNLFENNSQY